MLFFSVQAFAPYLPLHLVPSQPATMATYACLLYTCAGTQTSGTASQNVHVCKNQISESALILLSNVHVACHWLNAIEFCVEFFKLPHAALAIQADECYCVWPRYAFVAPESHPAQQKGAEIMTRMASRWIGGKAVLGCVQQEG